MTLAGTSKEKDQIDHQWIRRLRALLRYDAHWWLTWAGPFSPTEEKEWQQGLALPENARRLHQNDLMKQSRERELMLAWHEQREPQLHYPALAEQEVNSSLNGLWILLQEILQHEPNRLIHDLYVDVLHEEIAYLELLQATATGNNNDFNRAARACYQLPSQGEREYALSYVAQILSLGLATPEATVWCQPLVSFLQTHIDEPVQFQPIPPIRSVSSSLHSAQIRQTSARAVQAFFEQLFCEYEFADAKVVIEPITNPRFDTDILFLPDKPYSLEDVQHLVVHEFLGHAMRRLAGEHSSLGLLGIGTSKNNRTEEGLALYYENQLLAMQGRPWDDGGIRLATLAISMATGLMGKAVSFRELWGFLTSLTLIRMLIHHPQREQQKALENARNYALKLCLRTFRGVPDLSVPGACYPKDGVYLQGKWLIERAVANDPTVLDRLSIGRVSVEDLARVEMVLGPRREEERRASVQHLLKQAHDPDFYASLNWGE